MKFQKSSRIILTIFVLNFASCIPRLPGPESSLIDLMLAINNVTGSVSSIEGTISGVAGSVDIRLNGSTIVTLTTDGNFTYSNINGNYVITANQRSTNAQDPSKQGWASQRCTVTGGTGMVTDSTPVVISILCENLPIVFDPVNLKYWDRCVAGMTYDPVNNQCTGAYSLLQFCNANDNSCNDADTLTEPGVSGHLIATAASQIYTYCEGLNGGSGHGGVTTWRVPRMTEQKGVVYCSTGPASPLPYGGTCNGGSITPFTDPVLFPNTPIDQLSSPADIYYWTSSVQGDPLYAFVVGFSYYVGGFNGASKANPFYLQCVADG